MSVSELRLVVTVDDYDAAVAFYRDTLGLTAAAEYLADDAGRVIILEAGRATLELSDVRHAEHIDEVEVGRRVAGTFRVAFQVSDARQATDRAVDGGATLIAAPTPTPWNSLNSRLDAPGGMQLTLFEQL
jgi:catechol 2,3-dioxygenase-like lactoylglutathione lyase family enzyme